MVTPLSHYQTTNRRGDRVQHPGVAGERQFGSRSGCIGSALLSSLPPANHAYRPATPVHLLQIVIFTCNLTTWDYPHLSSLNPILADIIPANTSIAVHVRDTPAGETLVLTQYLSYFR